MLEKKEIMCDVCGKPVVIKRKEQVHCNNLCRQKAYRERQRVLIEAGKRALKK